MGKTAVVLLAPGFEEVEAVSVVDVLRRGGVSVTVAGVGGANVKGAHGITVAADAPLSEVAAIPDMVVLPGGLPGADNLAASGEARALAAAVDRAGGVVAAICAAPACALSAWGMLKARKATCYPGFEKRFPPDATFVAERVVVDGNLVTSRGPGTALEFALALVEKAMGPEKASKLASEMLAANSQNKSKSA